MLDTASSWSILGTDMIEDISAQIGGAIRAVKISTRYGSVTGNLHRVPILLIADRGKDVLIDSTCAVIPDWPGPSILGWNGTLERLNFAIHPGADASDEPTIYFGQAHP